MFNTLPTQDYDKQLFEKKERLVALLSLLNPPLPRIYSSPATHYRMRAEFRIWHENETLYHIMFDPKTKQRIRVAQFPAACQLINQLMPKIIDALQQNSLLRNKLFQIDYLTTSNRLAIISLIYHKVLTDDWTTEANSLQTALRSQGYQVQIIGRASKQKICLETDYIEESLLVAGQTLHYRQVENSFTQPNASVNVKMLEWALEMTQNQQEDLLELYCGNGNFSLALARNFRKVLATEIAKPSVAAAQYNIEVNKINNVQILRMSAEELVQAYIGTRSFNRMKHIDLADYHCSTLLLDPPRSGLDPITLNFARNHKRIIYISCNPDSLYQNLLTLTPQFKIKHLALFDQFPYTPHMECGVVLEAE